MLAVIDIYIASHAETMLSRRAPETDAVSDSSEQARIRAVYSHLQTNSVMNAS